MVKRAAVRLNTSPFSGARSVNWADTRELDELFRSERLEGPHGAYFDQRFVNFLAANFESIDKINWRQFEGLAGEYFARAGFAVELGPGRGDGGVDIRLWPSEDGAEGKPGAVLVQCKRQKAKIEYRREGALGRCPCGGRREWSYRDDVLLRPERGECPDSQGLPLGGGGTPRVEVMDCGDAHAGDRLLHGGVAVPSAKSRLLAIKSIPPQRPRLTPIVPTNGDRFRSSRVR